jgi:hypothetical protein
MKQDALTALFVAVSSLVVAPRHNRSGKGERRMSRRLPIIDFVLLEVYPFSGALMNW